MRQRDVARRDKKRAAQAKAAITYARKQRAELAGDADWDLPEAPDNPDFDLLPAAFTEEVARRFAEGIGTCTVLDLAHRSDANTSWEALRARDRARRARAA